MFSSWPVCAFVAGVKIGSGSRSDSRSPAGSRDRRSRRSRVVLPARAGEVAAHDALDRQHLEPPALDRAAVLAQREQVVRDELARPREPERGEAGEHAALVRDLGRQDDVEGRDPVAGDEEQALLVERVELATFPLASGPPPQAWACSSRTARAGARRRHRRDAWDEGLDFPELVQADTEIAARVDLDAVFDLAAYTRHVDVVFERLRALSREHVHA